LNVSPVLFIEMWEGIFTILVASAAVRLSIDAPTTAEAATAATRRTLRAIWNLPSGQADRRLNGATFADIDLQRTLRTASSQADRGPPGTGASEARDVA
jgi:hypothetical protein